MQKEDALQSASPIHEHLSLFHPLCLAPSVEVPTSAFASLSLIDRHPCCVVKVPFHSPTHFAPHDCQPDLGLPAWEFFRDTCFFRENFGSLFRLPFQLIHHLRIKDLFTHARTEWFNVSLWKGQDNCVQECQPLNQILY